MGIQLSASGLNRELPLKLDVFGGAFPYSSVGKSFRYPTTVDTLGAMNLMQQAIDQFIGAER